MNYLVGEYDCKLDAKGRMVVPAGLKRQLPDVERDGLVVNRGFEGNLIIYTRAEWNRILGQLNKLNQYQAKNRDFVRKFLSGATELMLDSAGRVLLPKVLLTYAGADSELKLVCSLKKVEVWSPEAYHASIENISEQDFSDMADNLMGDLDLEGGIDV